MFGYLLSYHYYRQVDLDDLAASTGEPDLTFFADSGAFSAWTTGQAIELEEYAAWLKRWRHRLHAYCGLDVLFDHQGTLHNLALLREHDLEPMPVFHLGSPMAVYDSYVAECPYIGIGGLASGTLTMRDPRLWKYLDLLHGKAQATGARLHGFGLSAWPVVRRFPWYSADSSTPGSGYRYGRIGVYDPYADTFRAWSLHDGPAWHRHGWLVREYGMEPADFRGGNVAIRGALIQLAARSWAAAARSLALTRLYVTDAAMAQRQGAGTRLAAYQQGNRWESGPLCGSVRASGAAP